MMPLPLQPNALPMTCLVLSMLVGCSDDSKPHGNDLGQMEGGVDQGLDTSPADAPGDLQVDLGDDLQEAGGDGTTDIVLDLEGDATPSCAQVEVVDSQGDVGMHTSLAADTTGALHIAYYDATAGQLRYATNKGGIWTTSLVDGNGDVGKYASLHLDAADKPIVAYFDATKTQPKVAFKLASGGWSVASIDTPTPKGLGTHLAGVRHADTLHLVYFEATSADLRYAKLNGGTWVFGHVEQSANIVGTHGSVAVDATGVVHVAYRDATAKHLRYARSQKGALSFSVQTIDSQGDVGIDTSIGIGPAGEVHVVYHDKANAAVKHALVTSPSKVTTETIESGGVGWYTAVAVDGSGGRGSAVINAAYYDYQNGTLRYATKHPAGVWKTMKVDGSSKAQVGWDLSMTLVNGSIHLAYYDAINTNLRHAVLAGCL